MSGGRHADADLRGAVFFMSPRIKPDFGIGERPEDGLRFARRKSAISVSLKEAETVFLQRDQRQIGAHLVQRRVEGLDERRRDFQCVFSEVVCTCIIVAMPDSDYQ